MNEKVSTKLKFRNQYILAPHSIDCPFLFNSLSLLGSSVLYTHVDLKVTQYAKGELRLILLGDMFDYKKTGNDNKDILKAISDENFSRFLKNINRYAGRFVIIYQNGDMLRLIHDTTAARKVYYSNWQDKLWFASQPHLLAGILGINRSKNRESLKFYESKDFVRLFNSNIGNFTIYDEIRQLLPNHFLDVNSFTVTRYWPNKKIEYQPINEVAKKCAQMIEGFMESITNRYNVMLPVTAGKDSRILLAATKRFTDKVFYYVNKGDSMNKESPDITVPRELLSKLDLEFNILNPNIEVDEDFKKIYYQNNTLASSSFLPLIYNYYLNFENRVNLPGNIASAGFEVYKNRRMKITGKNLAKLNQLSQFGIAENYYNKWILESQEVCRKHNVNMLNLFYWEERLANWGTQIQIEKDIAQEDINPFNSRDLVGLFLSVHPKYISIPFFKLHRRIIKILWPEVLQIPINPGRRTTLLKLFKSIGILDIYYRLKYSRLNNY
ncbi:MAG: hypothetical protein ABFS32_13780 [Bacteroidota bacterium]